MVDEQKQQQLIEEIGIRLSKLANLEADELAQAMNEGSLAIFALIEQNHILREERTAWRVTAENSEAAVKQARIDALEEAKQACNEEADQFRESQKGASDGRYDWKEDGARDCAAAIESLKGKTP